MNLIAAIERNRTRLLHIVACWLILATLVKCGNDRVLPPRFARLVSNLLSKIDASSRLLAIATARLQAGGLEPVRARHRRQGLVYPVPAEINLTISDVVSRLKMVRVRLRNLDLYAKQIVAKWRAARVIISFFDKLRHPQSTIRVMETCAVSNFVPPIGRFMKPP